MRVLMQKDESPSGPVEWVEHEAHEVADVARRTLSTRVGRIVAGFAVMVVGIALLPLPIVGPGWILLLVGLSLLPFAWAQRATTFIRRHIPGIPEDGRIPTRTWVIAGVIMVVLIVVCSIFGPKLFHWISGLF